MSRRKLQAVHGSSVSSLSVSEVKLTSSIDASTVPIRITDEHLFLCSITYDSKSDQDIIQDWISTSHRSKTLTRSDLVGWSQNRNNSVSKEIKNLLEFGVSASLLPDGLMAKLASLYLRAFLAPELDAKSDIEVSPDALHSANTSGTKRNVPLNAKVEERVELSGPITNRFRLRDRVDGNNTPQIFGAEPPVGAKPIFILGEGLNTFGILRCLIEDCIVDISAILTIKSTSFDECNACRADFKKYCQFNRSYNLNNIAWLSLNSKDLNTAKSTCEELDSLFLSVIDRKKAFIELYKGKELTEIPKHDICGRTSIEIPEKLITNSWLEFINENQMAIPTPDPETNSSNNLHNTAILESIIEGLAYNQLLSREDKYCVVFKEDEASMAKIQRILNQKSRSILRYNWVDHLTSKSLLAEIQKARLNGAVPAISYLSKSGKYLLVFSGPGESGGLHHTSTSSFMTPTRVGFSFYNEICERTSETNPKCLQFPLYQMDEREVSVESQIDFLYAEGVTIKIVRDLSKAHGEHRVSISWNDNVVLFSSDETFRRYLTASFVDSSVVNINDDSNGEINVAFSNGESHLVTFLPLGRVIYRDLKDYTPSQEVLQPRDVARLFLQSGMIVRYTEDDHTIVLYPDGSLASRKAGDWTRIKYGNETSNFSRASSAHDKSQLPNVDEDDSSLKSVVISKPSQNKKALPNTLLVPKYTPAVVQEFYQDSFLEEAHISKNLNGEEIIRHYDGTKIIKLGSKNASESPRIGITVENGETEQTVSFKKMKIKSRNNSTYRIEKTGFEMEVNGVTGECTLDILNKPQITFNWRNGELYHVDSNLNEFRVSQDGIATSVLYDSDSVVPKPKEKIPPYVIDKLVQVNSGNRPIVFLVDVACKSGMRILDDTDIIEYYSQSLTTDSFGILGDSLLINSSIKGEEIVGGVSNRYIEHLNDENKEIIFRGRDSFEKLQSNFSSGDDKFKISKHGWLEPRRFNFPDRKKIFQDSVEDSNQLGGMKRDGLSYFESLDGLAFLANSSSEVSLKQDSVNAVALSAEALYIEPISDFLAPNLLLEEPDTILKNSEVSGSSVINETKFLESSIPNQLKPIHAQSICAYVVLPTIKPLKPNHIYQGDLKTHKLPMSISASKPGLEPNTKYMKRENLTTHAISSPLKGNKTGNVFKAGLVVLPGSFDFGRVKYGSVFTSLMKLTNIGVSGEWFIIRIENTSRFKIDAVYERGKLAAGMCRSIKVVLGLDDPDKCVVGAGEIINEVLVVSSQYETLRIPILAIVE